MKRVAMAAAAMVLAVTAGVRAGPVDLKEVPAGTRWLVHFDVDAIRGSQLWKTAFATVDAQTAGEASQKLEALATLLGTRLEDLHSVTMVGNGVEQHGDATTVGGAIVVHAKMDRERLMALAKLNPQYLATPYGEREVSSWNDAKSGKKMYGAFASDGVLVLAGREGDVKEELDVLAGKAKPFAGEGAVAAAGEKGAGAMFFMAGEGLADLQKAKDASPVLAKLDSAWVSVGETAKDVMVRGMIRANSDEAAKQFKAMIDGFKALAVLSLSSQTGGDVAEQAGRQLAADVLGGRAQIVQSGREIVVEVPVGLDALKNLAEVARGAATQPATRPKE